MCLKGWGWNGVRLEQAVGGRGLGFEGGMAWERLGCKLALEWRRECVLELRFHLGKFALQCFALEQWC